MRSSAWRFGSWKIAKRGMYEPEFGVHVWKDSYGWTGDIYCGYRLFVIVRYKKDWLL